MVCCYQYLSDVADETISIDSEPLVDKQNQFAFDAGIQCLDPIKHTDVVFNDLSFVNG